MPDRKIKTANLSNYLGIIAAALTNFVMWFISAESSNTIDSGRQRAKKERMLIIQNNLDNALQKMILCCINFLLGLTYKNIFIWKRGLHLCRIASDITGKWLIGGISCFDRLNSKLYWINGINEKSVIWRRNPNWTRFIKGLSNQPFMYKRFKRRLFT